MDSKTSRDDQHYHWHGERLDDSLSAGRARRPALRAGADVSLLAVVSVLAAAAVLLFSTLPAAGAWIALGAVGVLVGRYADALTAAMEVCVLVCLAAATCWAVWTFVSYIAVI